MQSLSSVGTNSQKSNYSIKTSTPPKNKKDNIPKHICAGILGNLVANQISNFSKLPINQMANSAFRDVIENNELYKESFIKVLDNSNLKQKGLKVIKAQDLTEEGIDILIRDCKPKWLEQTPKFYQQLVEKTDRIIINETKAGLNACFLQKLNVIALNTEKILGMGFHELGHAINYNNNNILRTLSKIKSPISVLTIPICMIAAFKPKKQEGEKPKNIIDKTTTFVKNNAGKLAFSAMLPQLIEEGCASIKAAQIAKPLLSKQAFKLMNKANATGWLTYFGSAVALGIGAMTASWVHDKITEPSKNK